MMTVQATQVLPDISRGDRSQRELLFELVYDDFRRIAQDYIAHEGAARKDLQATDVVHEAYLRLIDQTSVSWKDRSHFQALGARIMRNFLVDEARKRLAKKRGGKARQVGIDIVEKHITVSPQSDEDVLAMHEAVEKLANANEQRAMIVEYRFFGGLTVEETAEVIGTSKSTIEREWRVARAWLRRELADSAD